MSERSTNGHGDAVPESVMERLRRARPGDAVEIWMENTFIVRTVLLCSEVIDGALTEWRWMFLDDGSLVEASPDGFYRYTRHELVRQGSLLYEELAAQDGALVRFEQRVREGVAARRPVHVTLGGREYRIASTGTLRAERLGEEPELLPWKSFSDDPGKNVYFGLVTGEEEEAVALGLWTQHICISFGAPLDPARVSAVYNLELK